MKSFTTWMERLESEAGTLRLRSWCW